MISLLGALAILLQAFTPSAFYLLVYFGLLMGLTTGAILAALPGRVWRAAFMLLCLAFPSARALSLRVPLPAFDHMATLSTNFQDTLQKVKSTIATERPRRVVFIRRTEDDWACMFVSATGQNDYALSPYLASKSANSAAIYRQDQSIKDVAPAQPPDPKTRDLQVFLGPNLQIGHMTWIP